ncbi:hypothetical protein Tco_0940673 [Tanacetum coccineum]|uniref:Uncharacterized protein n=1 Tax=Tanacetum coccineum TaxID=301880 RepID=A0ABQ5DPJ4_9ASTR
MCQIILIGFGIESSNSMESDISSGDETLTDSAYENFKREKAYKAVPPPTGTIIPPRANIEDGLIVDDEETDVSEKSRKLLLTQRIVKHLLKTAQCLFTDKRMLIYHKVQVCADEDLWQRQQMMKLFYGTEDWEHCKSQDNNKMVQAISLMAIPKEGLLLGNNSTSSKGFRVYNRVTRKVQECLHVNFLENQENQKGKGPDWMFDLDLLTPSMNYIPVRKENYADSEKQKSLAKAHNDDQRIAFLKGKEEYLLQRGKEHDDSTFTSKRQEGVIELNGFLEIKRDERGTIIKKQSTALVAQDVFQECMSYMATSRKKLYVKQLQVLIGLSHVLTASRPDIMFACLSDVQDFITPKDLSFSPLECFFPLVTMLGDNHDRRSTSRGCQYLEEDWSPWQCKKPTIWLSPLQEAEKCIALQVVVLRVAAKKNLISEATIRATYSLMIETRELIACPKQVVLGLAQRYWAYEVPKSTHREQFGPNIPRLLYRGITDLRTLYHPFHFLLSIGSGGRTSTSPHSRAQVLQGMPRRHSNTESAGLNPQRTAQYKIKMLASYPDFESKSDELKSKVAEVMFAISRQRFEHPSYLGPIQTQPQQPTQGTDSKDKGKGILVEEPKKKKLTLQQIRALETTNDEEVARKIQAEWDAEEERKRFEELKKTKPKTTLRKPTSLAQERNQMMSFLKGQGYKNLQKLKYPQMKELYDKVQASIKDSFKDFIPMDSEKERETLKEREAKRLLRKRKATISEEQPSKKPKLRTETIDELRNYLRVVDFEKNAQDRESLEGISMITELQVIDSPDGEYLIIHRENNHFRAFDTLWEILHVLDRQDLYHLYRVVEDYYEHIPPTGLGLMLLGDLNIIWETAESSDDDFWKDQEEWEIIRWRFHESSGVHTLEIEDGTMIHMLAERRYPLSRELMIRMLEHGMEVEDESETAITLIHLFILWTTASVHHGLLPFLGTKELTSPRVNGYLIRDFISRCSQTDCVQDTAQRKKFKRLKASTAFKSKQTDAEQRRPTIKKLEVKQVEFKLGEDCWEIQVKSFKLNGKVKAFKMRFNVDWPRLELSISSFRKD